VVDLAVLREEDIAAILDQLGVSERHVVEKLLKEYVTGEVVSEPAVAELKECDASRLSPWLLERVRPTAPEGRSITVQTHKILREVALELCPAPDKSMSRTVRRRGSFGAVSQVGS
jgi:hypothetical protein